MFRVVSLHHYPVKSCRGLSVGALELDRHGPVDDRRFMLVNESGRFVTQREHHRLALVTATLSAGELHLQAPDAVPLGIPLGVEHPVRPVRVWSYEADAGDCGEDAATWFSTYLGVPVRLVEFNRGAVRIANPKYAPEGTSGGLFTDGYPVLLATEASLADLNARLPAPLSMSRFRPNVVVTGSTPFQEDGWTSLRIGDVAFRVTKPSERCVVTTVDPETGRAGKEPLATLAKFRKRDGAVYFATNLVHLHSGTIRVGDAVTLE